MNPEDAAGHRRQEARRHGNTPSKLGLLRDGWHLVVTNLNPSVFPGERVDELYATRWSVEIQFRALKRDCRLGSRLNHRTDRHHIETLDYAAMIFPVLNLRQHAVLRGKAGADRLPRLEKVSTPTPPGSTSPAQRTFMSSSNSIPDTCIMTYEIE